MLETTKKGQGLVVRRVTFWSLVVLLVWAGQSLYTWLLRFKVMKTLALDSAKEHSTGAMIPVLNQRFDWAFVTSWLFVAVSLVVVHRILNRSKTADFLIDTDNELKKVTWPTWKDAWQSSVIVVVFVFLLTGLLLISDFILNRSIGFIL